MPKLISRKIWVAEKFLTLHIPQIVFKSYYIYRFGDILTIAMAIVSWTFGWNLEDFLSKAAIFFIKQTRFAMSTVQPLSYLFCWFFYKLAGITLQRNLFIGLEIQISIDSSRWHSKSNLPKHLFSNISSNCRLTFSRFFQQWRRLYR